MSRIPPMSYAEALRIVARDDERVKRLDKLLGGLIFVAAPFTAFGSLALVDPKTEAVALIREMTGTAAGRIKGTVGKRHLELLEAAHTVLGLSALFDAFAEVAARWSVDLDLTDDDKHRVAGRGFGGAFPRELESGFLPMPTPVRGFEPTLALIEIAFHRLTSALLDFLAGLEAWEQVRPGDTSELSAEVTAKALEIYQERFVRFAVDIPEFGFWMQLDAVSAVSGQVERQSESLAALHEKLASLNPVREAVSDVERKLARLARSVLAEPIWRTATAGLTFPAVREGFISANFRLVVADKEAKLTDESWWHEAPPLTDLAGFLTEHLASPSSAKQPLIILGHPGAGKTLLSEVVAARVPAESFTTILVKLRRVDADADPHRQIEAALESSVRESLGWGPLCRESATTKVVIFDGLDELIQATGTTQTDYIERVTDFQRNEWLDGNAVITIITSRLLVMDRMRVPDGATVIRLEDFSDTQVERWTDIWNGVNERSPGFRPLSAAAVLAHDELARQPLLLFLLAIYAASETSRRLDEGPLSGADLYRELLDSFITRQIRDKATGELSQAAQRQRERTLRRDLSIAAFAMFNRGRQFITEEELGEDLRILAPAGPADGTAGFAEPLSRAKATVAAFFFIHVSHAREHDEQAGLRSYEFLHATFAEYLVAEFAATEIGYLADDWERLSARDGLDSLDDDLLFALLSHRALTGRQPVVGFLRQMLRSAPDPESLRTTLGYLFHRARKARNRSALIRYAPTPQDTVTALAAYTANLATMLAVLTEQGVAIEGFTTAPNWTSTVRLWRAGLDSDGQQSLFAGLTRQGDCLLWSDASPQISETLDAEAAAIIGDYQTETMIRTGATVLGQPEVSSPSQRDAYLQLAYLQRTRWPVPSLDRMTPFDEQRYQFLLDTARDADPPVGRTFIHRLFIMLIDDGPHLDPKLTLALVRFALTYRPPAMAGMYFLTALAHRCPYLLEDETFVRHLDEDRAAPGPLTLLLLDMRTPDQPRETWLALPGGLLASTQVVPDMVRHLADTVVEDYVVRELLNSLSEFGALAWSRIEPEDMARLLRDRPDLHGAGAVQRYLAYLRSAGVPEERLAGLAALVEPGGDRAAGAAR